MPSSMKAVGEAVTVFISGVALCIILLFVILLCSSQQACVDIIDNVRSRM